MVKISEIQNPGEPETEQRPEAARTAEEPLIHQLVITLNRERYFIPLSLVSKVVNPLEIFPLPHSLPFLAGVANFLGEIIPVVDLKKALKLPDLGSEAGVRFVICKYSDIKVCFVADSVIDSWEIPVERLKNDTTRVLENDFISGEYIFQDEVIAAVDIIKFIETHRAD